MDVNFVTLGQIGTGTYEVPSKIKGEYEEVENSSVGQ